VRWCLDRRADRSLPGLGLDGQARLKKHVDEAGAGRVPPGDVG
jgi:hypothetical protein